MRSNGSRFAITVVTVLIAVSILTGGMDFTKFLLSLAGIGIGYVGLGLSLYGIGFPYTWFAQLKPWEVAANVFLGRPLGLEGPGGLVMLIPLISWIQEIVDLRDQTTVVGPFQATTQDVVELAGVSALLTHRIARDEKGVVAPETVMRWAYGTSQQTRQNILTQTPAALLRQRVGTQTLEGLLGAAATIPMPNDVLQVAKQLGREFLTFTQGPIDVPDEFREQFAQRVAQQAEARGLGAILSVLAEAKDKGVLPDLVRLRTALVPESVSNNPQGAQPIIMMGGQGRDSGLDAILALLAKQGQPKKDGGEE